MPIFSSSTFAICVALCYVLGQLAAPASRTTWFGILNAIAVLALFGWQALLVLAGLVFATWVALHLVLTFLPNKGAARAVAAWAIYAGIGLLFVMHKSLLEPGNAFSAFPPLVISAEIANLPAAHLLIDFIQLMSLSYIVLRLIDLVRSVLDGSPLLNPVAMSGYVVPFFMTPAGPVNVYAEHIKMDGVVAPPPSAAHFIDNAFLIASGYFLKFVVAALFSIFMVGLSGQWPTYSVGGTALFLMYVFLEFSGYSLIALGVGGLLGVPTPVNFNHPYLATSVGEFWNRWHMSLGAFVRRNLYTPSQVFMMRRFGRKNRDVAYYTNILALWLPFAFVGVWHRFTWSFLLWGISLGAIVAAEKVVRDRVWSRMKGRRVRLEWLSKPFGIVYTLLVVVVTLHIASGDFIR